MSAQALRVSGASTSHCAHLSWGSVTLRRRPWYRVPVAMGSSRTGSRALILALSIAVIGLSIALFMIARSPQEQAAPAPATERPAPPPEERGSGFARAPAPNLANPGGPPARAFNELGQPLDENG